MTTGSITPGVPGSAHVKLAFDDNESLSSGVPRSIGLRLAKTPNYSYSVQDDAARTVVDEARANGFAIDELTLELSFSKRDWSKGFGAYTDKPEKNRPAFSINMDTRRPNPIIASAQRTTGVGVGKTVFPARISDAKEFKGVHYVCVAGKYIYKMENWPTDPYFTLVFTHSNGSCVFRHLEVHNDVLYAGAGATAPYAYTENGADWTESNRTGNDCLAEQFLSHNGRLHKTRTPNYHTQTDDGRNGGTAWTDEQQVGSSSSQIQMMNAMRDNVVFNKDEGIFNWDGYEFQPVYPELQKVMDDGNGWHAHVWNNALFYPTLHGELLMLKEGTISIVTAACQQERRLEGLGNSAIFVGRVKCMASTPQYLYAQVQRAVDNKHRIVVCEEVDGQFRWHTMWDYASDESDEMWITSKATSGPVLWSTFSTYGAHFIAYWIIPTGPDPLQDSRMVYGTSGGGGGVGYLYDPWIDMGLPTTPKRWASLELEAVGTSDTGQTAQVLIHAEGLTTITKTLTLTTTPQYEDYGLPYNFISRRIWIETRLITDATHLTGTPMLIGYRITAFARPTPVRIFNMIVEGSAAGTTWGTHPQKELRAFLEQARTAQLPLILTNPFGVAHRVVTVKPFPIEQALSPRPDGWDEAFTLRFIEIKIESWS